MSNQIMISPGLTGKVSKVFKPAENDTLGAGVRSGLGVIGYRGKTWSTKWAGEERVMMREDGDGAKASIDVVIVKASPHISKIYYEGGYVDGSNAAPTCMSTNGITPDASVPAETRQSATCAACPKNAWGSKVTEAGKQGKACTDGNRLAVVPLGDLRNETMGGAMLLRVPAASLKDLKTFGTKLQSMGYPYYSVAVKIGFDVNESYPKFTFTATRELTDEEAAIVAEHMESQQVKMILSENEATFAEPAKALPASPFGVTVGGTPAVDAVDAEEVEKVVALATGEHKMTKAEPRKRRTKEEMEQAAAALRAKQSGNVVPGPAPVTPVVEPKPVTSKGKNFDAMLDDLLPVED